MCTSHVNIKIKINTSLESTAAYIMSIQPLKVACNHKENSKKNVTTAKRLKLFFQKISLHTYLQK